MENVPSERAQVHAAAQSRLSSSCSVTQTENHRLKNGFCWEHSLTAHRVLNQHVAPTGRRTGSRRRTLLKIIRHSSVKFEIQIKHRFKNPFGFRRILLLLVFNYKLWLHCKKYPILELCAPQGRSSYIW